MVETTEVKLRQRRRARTNVQTDLGYSRASSTSSLPSVTVISLTSLLVALLPSPSLYCDAFGTSLWLNSLQRPVHLRNPSGTGLFNNPRRNSEERISQHHRNIAFEPVRHSDIDHQFRPRYATYLEGKYTRQTQPPQPQIRTANPSTIPSADEQHQLSAKIARLLSNENDWATLTGEIADRETVFSKLSDRDLQEASEAVSKGLKAMSDSDSSVRHKEVKPRVTALVSETGHETIQQYVKIMANHHQVLRSEDEAVLGRQIQIFSRWEEKRQELELEMFRPPTFVEWAAMINETVPELKKQIRRSQMAKAALVEANLRLVVTVARQTVKRNRSEISFQDACQEGILGLGRAAEKFDPDKGFRFSSYAVWWIRKFIHKSVTEQSRPMRLPASAMRKINDIRIQEKVLADELGRKPRDDEVATKVGISVEKLEFYRRSLQQVTSLDKKIQYGKNMNNVEDNPDLHQVVKDSSDSPTEHLSRQMMREDVRRLISTLSPREQAVIRMRFGLDTGVTCSLEEIGHKFRVETEMIRKIEARAIRKLQQPYRHESIKPYIKDLC